MYNLFNKNIFETNKNVGLNVKEQVKTEQIDQYCIWGNRHQQQSKNLTTLTSVSYGIDSVTDGHRKTFKRVNKVSDEITWQVKQGLSWQKWFLLTCLTSVENYET